MDPSLKLSVSVIFLFLKIPLKYPKVNPDKQNFFQKILKKRT